MKQNLITLKYLVPTMLVAYTMKSAAVTPENLVQTVNYGSGITLRLNKTPLRGEHFEVLVQNSTGGYDTYQPTGERAYMGTVDEYPGALAAGILLDNGTFQGTVQFDRGAQIHTLGTDVTISKGTGNAIDNGFNYPTKDSVLPGSHPNSTVYEFDAAFDASYSYYHHMGDSVDACLEQIEFSATCIKAIYLRDALVMPKISRVVVRTSQEHDPYDNDLDEVTLDDIKSEWVNNQGSERDTVSCLFKPGYGNLNKKGAVGLANIVRIGGNANVNWVKATSNGNFESTWRHELGHNWWLSHGPGDSPEGPTIMSGDTYARFSGSELNRLLEGRDDRLNVLDAKPPFSDCNIPPYAALDPLEVNVETGWIKNISISPLANDSDANGHSISLLDYQAVSQLGRTVTLSPGTGPNGEDELVYMAEGEAAFDYFSYTIVDSSGQTATGFVFIQVNAIPAPFTVQPIVHWSCDDAIGTTASDDSGFLNHGTVLGDALWTAQAVKGGGIALDGTDDYVQLAMQGGNTGAFTVAFWAKKSSDSQNEFCSPFSNNTSSSASNSFQVDLKDGYRYSGSTTASFGTAPLDQWVHLAVVSDGADTKLYRDGSLVTTLTGVNDDSFTTLRLGLNRSGARFFNGEVDDFYLFDGAATDQDIQTLAAP